MSGDLGTVASQTDVGTQFFLELTKFETLRGQSPSVRCKSFKFFFLSFYYGYINPHISVKTKKLKNKIKRTLKKEMDYSPCHLMNPQIK